MGSFIGWLIQIDQGLKVYPNANIKDQFFKYFFIASEKITSTWAKNHLSWQL